MATTTIKTTTTAATPKLNKGIKRPTTDTPTITKFSDWVIDLHELASFRAPAQPPHPITHTRRRQADRPRTLRPRPQSTDTTEQVHLIIIQEWSENVRFVGAKNRLLRNEPRTTAGSSRRSCSATSASSCSSSFTQLPVSEHSSYRNGPAAQEWRGSVSSTRGSIIISFNNNLGSKVWYSQSQSLAC